MKKLYLFLFACMPIHTVSAQTGLFPYREGTKFGYKDSLGKIIVPAKYGYVSEFSEGMGLVRAMKEPDTVGFVNTKGNLIAYGKYSYAESFNDGYAKVGKGTYPNTRYGYIDRTGKEVIAPAFEAGEKFSEGLAAVRKNGKYGFIDKEGKEVLPFNYSKVMPFSSGMAAVMPFGASRMGLIDRKGKMIVDPKYDMVFPFEDGMAVVATGDFPDMKYGYIDKTGKEIIPPGFGSARDFSEGLAAVSTMGMFSKNKGQTFYYIDKKGKKAITEDFSEAYEFHEGLARVVSKDNKNCFIDRTGKKIFEVKYVYGESIGDFENGKVAIKKGEDIIYCLDRAGKRVSEGNRDYTYYLNLASDQVAKDKTINLQALNECIRLNPGAAECYGMRGWYYLSKKMYDSALLDANNGVASSPESSELYYLRATTYSWLSEKNFSSNHTKALNDYAKTIALKPDLAKAWIGRGAVFYTMAQKDPKYGMIYLDSAITHFSKAILLNPDMTDAYFRRAMAYEGKGNDANALADSKKAFALDPKNEQARKLAEELSKKSGKTFGPSNVQSGRKAPEIHESSFQKALKKATNSEERGKALVLFTNEIMRSDSMEEVKIDLVADKYKHVIDLDFEAVYRALIMYENEHYEFISKKVIKKLIQAQQDMIKRRAQYSIDEFNAKQNKRPVPPWPADILQPGKGWGQ